MKQTHALFLSLLFTYPVSAEPFIVKDGQPTAEIVVATAAHEGVKRAAEDLQFHLEKISGAALPVVNAPSKEVPYQLYVGENEFTKALGYSLPGFHNSGYDILVTEHYAVFAGPTTYYPAPKFNPRDPKSVEAFHKLMGYKCGLEQFESGGAHFNTPLKIFSNDDVGPWHAVSAFLESLGVRFYAPYENGTIFPEMKNVSLRVGRTTKEAAYGRREWAYGPAMRSDKDGVAWLKRLMCGNRSGLVYNHTTRVILEAAETAQAHPEWLAEEKPGKRFEAHGGQCQGIPRYTDPGFQQACVDWARKLLDTYPQLGAVTLGAPDGGNPYDWRDRQKYEANGLSAKQGYADMMWDFHCAIARELKKSHPDKGLIWWCQYNDSIPTNIDPANIPDNLIFPGAAHPADLVLDTTARQFREYNEKITEVFNPKMKGPAWEWWLSYRSPTAPRFPIFFGKRLQEFRQFNRGFSDGSFMEVFPAWQTSGVKVNEGMKIGEVPISHLMMYVNMKLLWDPDLDLVALLNEYYKNWYGPAEKEMKAFHEFAEQVWCRQESRSVTANTGFLKEADVEQYFTMLAEAKAKAPSGTIYHARIEAMEKGYEPLKRLFPSLKREGPLVRAYPVPETFPLDGDMKKYPHNEPEPGAPEPYPPIGFGWHKLLDHGDGKALSGEELKKVGTHVSVNFQPQSRTLCIAAVCYEPEMASLAASATKHDDDGIFYDDVIEIYLDSPERSFFKVVVNPNGAIYDETQDVSIVARDSLPILWNPGVKANVKKYDDRWEAEIRIPCADLGVLGPTEQYPWGLQIGRTRIASLGTDKQKHYSLSPTGGAYRVMSKWARMWVR